MRSVLRRSPSDSLADIVKMTLRERSMNVSNNIPNVNKLTKPQPKRRDLTPLEILRLARLRERHAARLLQRAWRRHKAANMRLAVQEAVETGKMIRQELVKIRRTLEQQTRSPSPARTAGMPPASLVQEFPAALVPKSTLFAARVRLTRPLLSPVALDEFLGRAKLRREDLLCLRLHDTVCVLVASKRGNFQTSDVDRDFPSTLDPNADWKAEVEQATKKFPVFAADERVFEEISDSEAHEFVRRVSLRRPSSDYGAAEETVHAFGRIPVLGRRGRGFN